MKTNLFKRIYLNGDPERLPKEGKYTVKKKSGEIYSDYTYEPPINDGHIIGTGTKYIWLENIDWYLSPVSREEIIEVLKKKFPVYNLPENDEFFESIADELIGGNK